jgi:hypothetical protein
VRQMTRYLGEREERAWYAVGEAFAAPAAANREPPAVDAPNGERLTERNLTTNGDLIVNGREPGYYRLRYPDTTAFAAVNLDRRESDLTKLDLTEFTARLTGGEAKDASVTAAESKLSKEELESQQRVWWMLLIAALLLFVAEAFIARRIKMAKVIG